MLVWPFFTLSFFYDLGLNCIIWSYQQERYRQHFLEEERELLPYMEAAELNKEQQQGLLDQCVDVMQETHSHNLFIFLLQGLLPHEAMHYLDLISMCSNKERTASMLQMII